MGRLSRRAFGLAGLLLAPGLASGSCDSSSSSAPPPESPKIRITLPTTASSTTVQLREVELGGWASIDAWSYSFEVEPNVRWVNLTTGAASEASEHVDWIWFFGWLPSNHTWGATVPLAPGWNEVRVEAYYATSGTVIGSDSIRVRAP